MNTLSSKLTALAAALFMIGLVMGRRRLPIRDPVTPPYVGDLIRSAGRRASMVHLVRRLRRDVVECHRLHLRNLLRLLNYLSIA
jgi:hypothetical protein